MLRLFGAEVFGGGEYDVVIGLSYQAIVANSQIKYSRGRRRVGAIAYQAIPSPSRVTANDDVLTSYAGVATVARDARFDFHDGSFSFLIWITPHETQHAAVAVEESGSW
ncbi:MAG TPA: hypothetical protein VKB96_15190 [Gammaproteobacteria bacterium]|nr:hypothetical protein [Gammaproteobacteria bacterium]